MISFILVTKNDSYSGSPSLDRLSKSLNINIKNLKNTREDFRNFEFLIGDWGSDIPITKNLLNVDDPDNLIQIYYFPKEITGMFDSKFNEVHSLNFLIRKSKHRFIARLDQDIIIGKKFFEYIGELNDKNYYWSIRRILEKDDFSENYSAPLNILHWPMDHPEYYKAAIGIICASKSAWHEIQGYNENMIYRNHMEHDLYERFKNKFGINAINLGIILDTPFFHIYHERDSFGGIKNNEYNVIFNNSDMWGLEKYKNIIIKR